MSNFLYKLSTNFCQTWTKPKSGLVLPKGKFWSRESFKATERSGKTKRNYITYNMSTCLHRFAPDTNLVQTKIGAVETFAKLFFGKSKPFSVIYEPSYLGFSEEICRTFQPPPLTYHAYYAPHTPYTNLLGHHFGSSSGLAWFGRFGPVWVESAPRWNWFIGWFFNWINMVPVRFLDR